MNHSPLAIPLARLAGWGAAAVVMSLSSATCLAQWLPPNAKPDAIVAQDGSGAYKTVQAAIDAIPAHSPKRFFLQIKPGAYKEKLVIPQDKGAITLFGDDAKNVILTYDDYAGKTGADGKTLGTGGSYSVNILPDDFAAENITFENTHPKKEGQGDHALAVSIRGDRAFFRKCRFTGWQDTMYLDRNRQYFEDCYISGQVDYIFGAATAFFQRCDLRCVGKGIAITAASTPQDQPFGFVFANCKITADPPANWTTNLGRPWKPYACVAYLNTEMAGIIAPGGWDNWRKTENEQTARFTEYKCAGPGANAEKRVIWAKQLSDEEAAKYTAENVLKGSDGWNPAKQP